MEFSQNTLNQGLTFLAYSTGVILFIVGGFLAKFLYDLAKLTRNLNETAVIVKTELEPTVKELNDLLKNVNFIMKSADQGVDKIRTIIENVFGLSAGVLSKAKIVSGSLLKGFFKGFSTVVKMFK